MARLTTGRSRTSVIARSRAAAPDRRALRTIGGASIAHPDWRAADERRHEVAVVLHVGADRFPQYATAIEQWSSAADVFVLLPEDAPVLPGEESAFETLRCDPVGGGLYQFFALANSGRLAGYATVIRHLDDASTPLDLSSDELVLVHRGLHAELNTLAICSRREFTTRHEKDYRRLVSFALARTGSRLIQGKGDVEDRSLSTIAMRGWLAESLVTFGVDHQDFYLKFFGFENEGLASETPASTRVDELWPSALERAVFALADMSGLAIVQDPELVPTARALAAAAIEHTAPITRARAWAAYHPDLTSAMATRNASWSHIVRSQPMFWAQQAPAAPTRINFADPVSPADRAEQVALAASVGIEGFLVLARWDEDGFFPAPFFDSLAPGEEFPWAIVVHHSATQRVDPSRNVPVRGVWSDPGVEHYADRAADIARMVGRGAYLRVDDRPVVAVQGIELLDDAAAFLRAVRDALAPQHPWIALVNTYIRGGRPHDPIVTELIDGVVQLPPADRHERNRAHLDARANGFVGPALNLYHDASDGLGARARTDADVIPGAMVGYDTTPVLRSQGTVGYNWNVGAFRRALERAVESVAWRPLDRRIVAISSWNGWAEMSHLEPSQQRGEAYLAAVRDTLRY